MLRITDNSKTDSYIVLDPLMLLSTGILDFGI